MAICIFNTTWGCPYEGDEIPLELCKLCVEARSLAHREERGFIIHRKAGTISEERKKTLSELNRKFTRGEISVDEYMDMRNSIR